ncbi:MAG: MBL fold metallo-hydrolase [Tepidisphaeraceae bacterium]
MPSVRVDVISIGTLSRNLLWKESEAVRTPHATCTLIRTDKRNLLIDPGLPGPVLAARLFERSGLRPEQIDTVFVTNSRPAHRAGAGIFTKAVKLIHELEQQFVLQHLQNLLNESEDDADDRKTIENEIALLESFKPADDKLAPQVELFPLFGYTPGTCGILVSTPTHSTLLTGDAVATADHLLAGQVLPGCVNLQQAKESLQEIYEIADIVIPGHDNVMMNPRSYGG